MIASLLSLSVALSPLALAEAPPAEAPPAEAPAEAVTYTLDPARSMLWVRTFKDTALTHDHAIHATGWSGAVTWHPEDTAQCNITVTVPVSGLVVDDVGVRQAAGIQADPPDEGDRRIITETMLGDAQLEAASFPTISFQSTSCSGTAGAVSVIGDMTIHGVSRSVTAALNVTSDSVSFTASGGFSGAHSDYGITPFSFLLGAFANGEKLQFGVNLVGTPG